MQSRTQLIIQQLGIQQWLPRQLPSSAAPHGALWRDQTMDDLASVRIHRTEVISHSSTAVSQTQLSENSPDQPSISKAGHITEDQPASLSSDAKPALEPALKPLSYDLRLDYQLLFHEQLVMVAAVEGGQQMQLLDNIAASCAAERQSLTWPLAISTWDMHDQLLESYLQGFFFGQQQKLLIILGDCGLTAEQLGFGQSVQLGSLAQLLASAEAKSALWDIIYPLIY